MIRDEKACLRWRKYSRGLEALGLFQKSYSNSLMSPGAAIGFHATKECVRVCVVLCLSAAVHVLYSSSLWLLYTALEISFGGLK